MLLAAAVVLLGAAPALGLAVGPRLDAIGAGTLPATWSNPLGAQLTRIADEVTPVARASPSIRVTVIAL